MLEVSLARLDREGSVAVDALVPPDDPMWAGMAHEWVGPVEVHLRVSAAGSGETVVRGKVRGALRQECRRCLEPLEREYDGELTMVFVDEEEVEAEDADSGELRIIPARASVLDLSHAVREETLLTIEPYVVCDPECKGLCPGCGTNLNTGSCTCSKDERDPRWDALRKLKEK